ncbi:uncharacterized protein LOC141713254 [Apium graveolens]|uniref:uncharacterized protein LOC141713254 n=1 Tax=Apium graveolens TaxID=4045 RepID=UPI003D7B0C44
MRTYLSENCSRVGPKHPLDRGSCDGLGIPFDSKRLKVDHAHQYDNPQLKKLKLGSERQAISPLKLPGQLAPLNTKCRSTERLVFHGKEAVNQTEKIPRRKIEMRPPKPIRDAVFIRPDGSPRERQFNCQNKRVETCKDSLPSQIQGEILFFKQTPGRLYPFSSSQCDVLSSGKYEADRRPLVEMRSIDNEGIKMGFKVEKAALKGSESDLRSIVGPGIAESRNLKVSRFDKITSVTPGSGKRMEGREKTGIVSISQSSMEQPKLSCQFSGGSSHGAKGHVRRTSYNSEGRKNEISNAGKLDCLGIHNSSYSFRDENRTSNIPCSTEENRCNSKVLNLNSAPDNDRHLSLYRDEVRKVLDLYKGTLERLQQEEKVKLKGKGKKGMQICVDAAMQLKEQHKWLNMQKCVGSVPGVEVGDQFHRRAELVIIGLHSKFVAGIDFTKIDGSLYATSIVASGRYGDKNDSSNVLIYVGEGGSTNSSSEKLEDQKLVRGNLALKNSINKVPIRVIRSIQNVTEPKSMHSNPMDKSKYFYDGLYFVRECWPERERSGNLVFMFRLERIQGQKHLTRWNTQNTSWKTNKASHGPFVVHDISKGKENIPIRAVNAIDCEKPPPFEYTPKMMYPPQQCVIAKSSVCDCLTGCAEDIACSCIIKNNYEVSVKNSVSIVYECGPSCKCPTDCKNRMTQHGLKLQLEVFKAIPKEWGVRSRNFYLRREVHL